MTNQTKILAVFAVLLVVAVALLARQAQGPIRVVDLKEINPSGSTDEPKLAPSFSFGFDPRASLEEDTRQYLPLLEYLSQKTGYNFDLRIASMGEVLADQLSTGDVQIAAVGAVSLLRADKTGDVEPLVQGMNNDGSTTYRAAIVVAADSDARDLSDLRGTRLALGNVDSTQGHVIPSIMFRKAGMTPDDFASHVFTGSHQNCANAVILGRADACGMQGAMADQLSKAGQLRILAWSDRYPTSGIAVNRSIGQEAIDRIRAALLEFDPEGRDREGLYNWDRTEMPGGFAAASDADYEVLRRQIEGLRLFDE